MNDLKHKPGIKKTKSVFKIHTNKHSLPKYVECIKLLNGEITLFVGSSDEEYNAITLNKTQIDELMKYISNRDK